MIQCVYWKDCGVSGGGCCQAGHYGGQPSFGVCNQCPHKNQEASTMSKAATYLKAQLTAKRVPLEVIQERYSICTNCQHVKKQNNELFCGVGCGCKLKNEDSRILKSLTEVEENLPQWGCKHPERSQGKGWKR